MDIKWTSISRALETANFPLVDMNGFSIDGMINRERLTKSKEMSSMHCQSASVLSATKTKRKQIVIFFGTRI
jgi:hypothetical protein